jgi:hypothetical protein
MADITLPAQPVFNVPRSFFDKVVLGTLINGEVYFSTEQCCELMEISYKNWSNRMVARTSSEVSRGPVQMDPLYDTYQIPVFTQSTSDTGRGGGTQLINFHHPKKLIEEAMTIRDAEKRKALVHWLINLGNEMIQQGFVIDQHALQNDPDVLPRFEATSKAFNFSPFRQEFAGIHGLLNWIFYRLSNILTPAGHINSAIRSRFMRSAYNSLYVSATGMSARGIKKTRPNPVSRTFGQNNYRGKYAPWDSELTVKANFLYDDELIICTGSARKATGNIMRHIRLHGGVDWREALQLFSAGCHSLKTLNYGPDHRQWPLSLPDTLTPEGVDDFSEKRANYVRNFPERHTKPMHEQIQMRCDESEIAWSALTGIDENGTPLPMWDDEDWQESGFVPLAYPSAVARQPVAPGSRGFDL